VKHCLCIIMLLFAGFVEYANGEVVVTGEGTPRVVIQNCNLGRLIEELELAIKSVKLFGREKDQYIVVSNRFGAGFNISLDDCRLSSSEMSIRRHNPYTYMAGEATTGMEIFDEVDVTYAAVFYHEGLTFIYGTRFVVIVTINLDLDMVPESLESILAEEIIHKRGPVVLAGYADIVAGRAGDISVATTPLTSWMLYPYEEVYQITNVIINIRPQILNGYDLTKTYPLLDEK